MDNIEKLLEQIRKKPGRADLHNSLGNLYQQKGNQPEAIKHFFTAARLFSMANSPSRNLNKALAILRRMVREFPDHYDSYFLLADTLREMDQQEEACHVYRSLSDLYRRDGKHLMAVSVFDKIISCEVAGLESLVRFGELNQEAGMPFHAAQAFMKAATLCCGENRGEEAPELVMRALKLDPENREAFELFEVLSREGKIQKSQEREILKVAEEVDRCGQYDQAIALLGLLERSAIREEAEEAVRKIRKHSGLPGEEGEGDLEGRKFLSEEMRGIKVLVVEDEREILLLLEQILAGEGLQVFTATDGEKGLEIFLRERPHLVVSDAMLPKLHGFELCRRIKEESPLGTKVMILTAVYKKYKYKGKVQEEYGVDEYLDKPFQITEFLEVISRMAEGVKKRARFDLLNERKKGKDGADRELSLLLAVRNDADLLAKVTVFCERKNIRMVRGRDPRELIELLMSENPDLFLFSDPFEGIDTDIIGPLLRDVLGNKWATLVLVSRDKSRMEGPHRYFDHRIFAPVDPPVLENVMSLHLSTRPASGDRRKGGGSFEEKRFESILRNKVERIIKSHSQLEEHFSSRIHELEAQNARLKEALSREKPDED